MYRLFDADEVTFTGLATPHWQRTRSLARGTVLLIGDTTETDFGFVGRWKGWDRRVMAMASASSCTVR